MEPYPVHEGVHQKTGPGQIADILEKAHQKKERNKIRENYGHSPADSLNQTDQQFSQQTLSVTLVNAGAERFPGLKQPGFQRAADAENQIEHSSKNQQQQKKSEHRMHDEIVKFLQAAHPGMTNPAAVFKYLQRQMMALGCQHLIGRSIPES